jgi:hypothetical protein
MTNATLPIVISLAVTASLLFTRRLIVRRATPRKALRFYILKFDNADGPIGESMDGEWPSVIFDDRSADIAFSADRSPTQLKEKPLDENQQFPNQAFGLGCPVPVGVRSKDSGATRDAAS